jgi:hypothetical protein
VDEPVALPEFEAVDVIASLTVYVLGLYSGVYICSARKLSRAAIELGTPNNEDLTGRRK